MKKINMKKIKVITYIYVIAVFVGAIITFNYDIKQASLPSNKKHIVIDAGHGGWDPGKVSSEGVNEKDINLEIATVLKDYFEQSGAIVSITRIEDSALDENKRQDLKKRLELANKENVDVFISIHQNSFPQESVKGAQVFYYKNSENGKLVAECIQNRLKQVVDEDNNRVAKENSSYYLLKNTSIPSVIVECGFLSNNAENKKLQDKEYQKKVAWALYMGVLDYFGENQI